MNINLLKKIWIIALIALVFPKDSYAVIPPDFVIQIGYGLGAFFSIASIILTVFLGFFTSLFKKIKKNWIIIFVVFVCLIGVILFFSIDKNSTKEDSHYTELVSLSVATKDLSAKKSLFNNVSAKYLHEKYISDNSIYILDVREDIEFETGSILNSHHVRYADIVGGEWQSLPEDKEIYIVCFTGLRGRIISDFLHSKGIIAHYISNGVLDISEYTDMWIGDTKIGIIDNHRNLRIPLIQSSFQKIINKGVFVVDTRNPELAKNLVLKDSIFLSTITTASIDLESTYSQIQTNNFIIICNNQVSCFDATIEVIELEKRGYHFLGIYIPDFIDN